MNTSPPNQAPTLAEDLHALREFIAAQVLAARLHGIIVQAILAAFNQIFDILERMVADWSAGRLPALPESRRTATRRPTQPDSAHNPAGASQDETSRAASHTNRPNFPPMPTAYG